MAPLEAAFVNSPARPRAVMAILDVKSIVEDVDTGEVDPLLRILRIEAVRPEDASTAEQLMRRAIEARSGMTTLLIELEDEIRAAFRDAEDDIPEPPGPTPTNGQESSADDAS